MQKVGWVCVLNSSYMLLLLLLLGRYTMYTCYMYYIQEKRQQHVLLFRTHMLALVC